MRSVWVNLYSSKKIRGLSPTQTVQAIAFNPPIEQSNGLQIVVRTYRVRWLFESEYRNDNVINHVTSKLSLV